MVKSIEIRDDVAVQNLLELSVNDFDGDLTETVHCLTQMYAADCEAYHLSLGGEIEYHAEGQNDD